MERRRTGRLFRQIRGAADQISPGPIPQPAKRTGRLLHHQAASRRRPDAGNTFDRRSGMARHGRLARSFDRDIRVFLRQAQFQESQLQWSAEQPVNAVAASQRRMAPRGASDQAFARARIGRARGHPGLRNPGGRVAGAQAIGEDRAQAQRRAARGTYGTGVKTSGLHIAADRPAYFAGLEPKVWLESSFLRTWVITEPQLILKILRNPHAWVLNVDDMIGAVEKAYGLEFPNMRYSARYLPLFL